MLLGIMRQNVCFMMPFRISSINNRTMPRKTGPAENERKFRQKIGGK